MSAFEWMAGGYFLSSIIFLVEIVVNKRTFAHDCVLFASMIVAGLTLICGLAHIMTKLLI